jgi:hypothetical protein
MPVHHVGHVPRSRHSKHTASDRTTQPSPAQSALTAITASRATSARWYSAGAAPVRNRSSKARIRYGGRPAIARAASTAARAINRELNRAGRVLVSNAKWARILSPPRPSR